MADETLFKRWKINVIWSVLPYRPWNAQPSLIQAASAFCSVEHHKEQDMDSTKLTLLAVLLASVMKICDMAEYGCDLDET